MFDETKKYSDWGHFFFMPGSQLNEVSKEVPNKPGVYYFLRLAGGYIDLVYIEKSGTALNDGQMKRQSLRGRLNSKQGDVPRQIFLEMKMKEEQIEGIDIYWFVTIDETHNDLPAYVEGLLIQRFYEVHGRLPEWNRAF